METTTSFLVRPWDLTYQADPAKAIEDNLWRYLPEELALFIGEVPTRPESLCVTVKHPSEDMVGLYRKGRPQWIVFEDFLAVEFRFCWSDHLFQEEQQDRLRAGVQQAYAPVAAARWLASIGGSIAQRIIMLLNISMPGFCSSRFATKRAEGFLFEESSGCFSWLETVFDNNPLFDKHSLPDLEPAACLKWGKRLDGLWKGLPKTNVERSFCYFSYIFDGEFISDEFKSVMWAIGALDAFYCETSVGLSEKLKRRIPLVLPDIEGPLLRKAINQIYADRSRTVHGDIRFVSNFFDPYHEIEDSESHMNLFASMPALYYLLVRSFGYAVERGATRIDFAETPVTS